MVVVVVWKLGVGAANDCNNNSVTFMPSRLVGGTPVILAKLADTVIDEFFLNWCSHKGFRAPEKFSFNFGISDFGSLIEYTVSFRLSAVAHDSAMTLKPNQDLDQNSY